MCMCFGTVKWLKFLVPLYCLNLPCILNHRHDTINLLINEYIKAVTFIFVYNTTFEGIIFNKRRLHSRSQYFYSSPLVCLVTTSTCPRQRALCTEHAVARLVNFLYIGLMYLSTNFTIFCDLWPLLWLADWGHVVKSSKGPRFGLKPYPDYTTNTIYIDISLNGYIVCTAESGSFSWKLSKSLRENRTTNKKVMTKIWYPPQKKRLPACIYFRIFYEKHFYCFMLRFFPNCFNYVFPGNVMSHDHVLNLEHHILKKVFKHFNTKYGELYQYYLLSN